MPVQLPLAVYSLGLTHLLQCEVTISINLVNKPVYVLEV